MFSLVNPVEWNMGERLAQYLLTIRAVCAVALHALKPAKMQQVLPGSGYVISVSEKPFDKMNSLKTGFARSQYLS